jgi:hypothetical protein
MRYVAERGHGSFDLGALGSTRETVAVETPARRATSSIVGIVSLGGMAKMYSFATIHGQRSHLAA